MVPVSSALPRRTGFIVRQSPLISLAEAWLGDLRDSVPTRLPRRFDSTSRGYLSEPSLGRWESVGSTLRKRSTMRVRLRPRLFVLQSVLAQFAIFDILILAVAAKLPWAQECVADSLVGVAKVRVRRDDFYARLFQLCGDLS